MNITSSPECPQQLKPKISTSQRLEDTHDKTSMPVDPRLLQPSLDEDVVEESDGLEDAVVNQLELDNLHS